MRPAQLIPRFDAHLAGHGLHLDAVILGGTALSLLGILERETRDCDVLSPDLPPTILEAAVAFAGMLRAEGTELGDDWLNNGPISLASLLPEGWRSRTLPLYEGQAIRLSSLGRTDMLLTKLWALCDRGIDLQDCLALAPTHRELACAQPWIAEQDAHPGWPAHVASVLKDLERRLGHGLHA